MNSVEVPRKRSGFNHLENFFEIEVGPDELRKIADEIDQVVKSDLFLMGQVVRYKLSSKFVIVHRPERRHAKSYETIRETGVLADDTDSAEGADLWKQN